jgi:hypothetical protein
MRPSRTPGYLGATGGTGFEPSSFLADGPGHQPPVPRYLRSDVLVHASGHPSAGQLVDTEESAPLPIDGSIIFQDNGKAIGIGLLGTTERRPSPESDGCRARLRPLHRRVCVDSNYPEYSFGAVTVTVPGTTTEPTLVSSYLAAKGKAQTMVKGGLPQITAYGTYSDGSVVALPNAGNGGVIAWNTSDHAVGKISKHGDATTMRKGTKHRGKDRYHQGFTLEVTVEAPATCYSMS